jgi:hypothetical protein
MAGGTAPAVTLPIALDEVHAEQVAPNGAVSVHFVNNVLAAAASYVEEDPDAARDALAELGAFLTHRLRPPRPVPLSDELDHVEVYLRLQEFRFPGRLDAEVGDSDAPRTLVGPGASACASCLQASGYSFASTHPIRPTSNPS